MTARWRVALGLLSLVWVPAVPGCRGDPGAGALHARKVVLEREVEGLRATAARLEEGEPVLPLEDVVVGIDETGGRSFSGCAAATSGKDHRSDDQQGQNVQKFLHGAFSPHFEKFGWYGIPLHSHLLYVFLRYSASLL